MSENTATEKGRSQAEVELSETLIGEQIKKTEAERKKYETEEELARYEVLEYERQERNAKAKHSEARIYNFVDQVSTGSVKSAIGTLNEWVRRDLVSGITPRPLTVVFQSPGGGVFPGMALFDAIKRIQRGDPNNDDPALRVPPVKVDTIASGYAASMAGILLQAGDVRIIEENAYILIHEISSLALGNTSEMEDEVKLMKRLQDRVLKIFVERSNMTKRAIETKWKRKDWWIDAEEAIEKGFADRVA